MAKYELTVPWWYVFVMIGLSGIFSMFVGGLVGSGLAYMLNEPKVVWVTIGTCWLVSFLILTCIPPNTEI